VEGFFDAITKIANWIWGPPMLILLVGGGIFLTIKLGFFQFKHLKFIFSQTLGKIFEKNTKGEGSITPFQALSSALASTIGGANIVGVPVAIAMGGPGAMFWMWVTAIVGQATKFSEATLGVAYRERNEKGEYVGGPYYYLKNGIKGSLGKTLGILCAFFFMIEILASLPVQTQSITQTLETINIPPIVSVIGVIIVVSIVVFGGVKRVGEVTEKMVPFMAIIYIILSLIIIICNGSHIPEAFAMIFKGAFTGQAAVGGFAGAGIAQAIRWGSARGMYSNEAGMGSTSISHAAASTDHPARQGLWGVFEVFMDTIVICTMTGLVVITSGTWKEVNTQNAGSATARAFQLQYGKALGGGFLSICVLLFVLSTIIVITFYCRKQAENLFGLSAGKIVTVLCLGGILYGAFGKLDNLFAILDITLALVIFPNMIGLVLLSGKVKKLKDDFFSNPKYYPKAKKIRK
jgi:AGCS family alanine or glycine:cation symporter